MEEVKPLSIYSASAGSGKTFQLVQTYLKLILGEGATVVNFSKIIAMTFTNKAAWEMKERIVRALDDLAFYSSYSIEEQNKRKGFFEQTQKNLEIYDPFELEQKAKKALSLILHNYEDFTVLTIDKFSLRLIRTFARDLDINQDFEVVLDEQELIENVIDELLSKLGNEGHEEITALAIDFAKSNLEEGDKWDFRDKLIQFAGLLKNEKDHVIIQKIIEKNFHNEDYQILPKEINILKASYLEIRNELSHYFQSLGLNAKDFPQGKRGLYGFLEERLPKQELGNTYEITATIKKTLSGENVTEKHNVPQELILKVITFLKQEASLKERYYVLESLRKNFHNLALLKYIATALQEIKNRDNIVRISEFNRMISELLQDENASYIYERLGTRYQHYLLDEFQDTSRLQWLNLLPLLHDSISQNKANLIVGDPKQAIYRFRNGLVEQFVALPRIYNPENEQSIERISNYFESMGEKVSLAENWRSKNHIVHFNNFLFDWLLQHPQVPEFFKSYYHDVKQSPKNEDGGMVAIRMEEMDDEVEFQEEYILETVRKCEQDGYKRGDICILARRKKEGARWAKLLVNAPEKYKVVSADSLLVSTDKSVQLCINYLQLRKNSGNKTLQIQFAVSYLRLKNEEPIIALQGFWINEKVGNLDFKAFVCAYFQDMTNFFMEFENLYDLGQKFSQLLTLSELKNPYFHHLMEMLQNYDVQYGPDIRGFLEYYAMKGAKETVQMPKNDEAIQIMTAHKAKGLEFKVVIIPSLTWDFNKVRDEQFIELDDGELIRTRLAKNNVPDFVSDSYQAEYEQLFLDELNLLYVSLTRPIDRMYLLVNSKLPKKETTLASINQLITQTLNAVSQANIPEEIKDVFQKNENEIIIGTAEPLVLKDKDSDKLQQDKLEEQRFNPKDISDYLWFPEISLQDEDIKESEDLSVEIRFGNQLHVALSKINSENEIDEGLTNLLNSGQIEQEFLESIKASLYQIFSLKDFQELVQGAKQIVNEQAILIDELTVKRPDKLIQLNDNSWVVLDYKTGVERNKHSDQLKQYIEVMEQMFTAPVKGYLFYTKKMQLVEVA